jgi:HEXXH motif-containing protein
MPTTAPELDAASLLPPFEGSLPTALRFSGESALLRFYGLNRETYSTERFLSDSAERRAGISKVIRVNEGNVLLYEATSPALLRYCAKHGLKLARDADTGHAIDLIEAAMLEVIAPFPFLQSALSQLAWRCHIVLAPSDDYDVSFSDPEIPFSIFVSVPARNDRRSVLRVAENLVHETMHLQLTLFESIRPLVDTTSHWSMYSPWKQQERPAQGVLHGLYVFCVLRWMWREISRTTRNQTDRDFALRRVSGINDEAFSVRALEESPALTEAGRHFLNGLFLA